MGKGTVPEGGMVKGTAKLVGWTSGLLDSESTHEQARPQHHLGSNPSHAVTPKERKKEPPKTPKSVSHTKAFFQFRKSE